MSNVSKKGVNKISLLKIIFKLTFLGRIIPISFELF